MINNPDILVIDAQGGGIGRRLIIEIKRRLPEVKITAVGTNSLATGAMLKAGADYAATGENAVKVNAKSADIITGPLGIVIADSMLGEITPAMAEAVGGSSAKKILIPINQCGNYIVGVGKANTNSLIDEAVEKISSDFIQNC